MFSCGFVDDGQGHWILEGQDIQRLRDVRAIIRATLDDVSTGRGMAAAAAEARARGGPS